MSKMGELGNGSKEFGYKMVMGQNSDLFNNDYAEWVGCTSWETDEVITFSAGLNGSSWSFSVIRL